MSRKIVFVNGCFDVLHRGHLELFEFAKRHGSHLVVALDTDERVALSKGPDRPFNNLKDRKKMVSSIKTVDWVEEFGSNDELIALIRLWSPDVMVVGTDWQGKKIIGSEFAGEVKFFERIDGYSTTKILQNSVDRG